jgi:assimilatory nitrate reductase catalytic subunit
MTRSVRTTCPYCGTGCGLLVSPDGDGWKVAGDPDHPANFGRLCSKGTALADTLAPDTRLLEPMVDGRPVDWDRAVAEAAGRIRSVIQLHGPDAFAFYLSGQLLTEDYYAANKLAKGFLGTANVDTNSRLCMASTVAGHRRAFGSDTVPNCYEDLETADLVVLAGSNLAWCHPVLFQRLKKARENRGTRVVVIDPRRTDCCDIADLHLALAPGSDVALWNGLLAHVEAAGQVDFAFVDTHCHGFTETLAAARNNDLSATGLAAADVATFFDWFAATPKVVTVFSQGVNQSSAGTDKVNAILNVHLATGRLGKEGCGPFSVTGQPNAMGGREVGGLANQLVAHMGFDPESVDRAGRFWDAPDMAVREGLKAVDLFHAVDQGKVKAIWIMGTNPAVSLPEADLVRRALAKCPVVIVSDCVADTDTVRFAHIRLPARAWGEKNGTVTNSDRTISRQRPFLAPEGEARPDWRAIADVAAHLGFGGAFAWKDAADIFDEYARLTAFENQGTRDLDLSDWIGADYDALRPAQWGGKRLFADGQFFTPDRRARLVPVAHRPPRETVSGTWPLALNTGRYRDHWHTMTRTGLSARLSGHRSEPLLDINPADARRTHVADGQLVTVQSRLGSYVARARVTDDQRAGDVFLPMHWTDRFAARSVVGRLIAGHVDPVSGQPESKNMPVRVSPFSSAWTGVLVTSGAIDMPPLPWWVRHAAAGDAHIVELAGDRADQQGALVAALDARFGTSRLEVLDPARGTARYAWMSGEHLLAALFVGRERPAIVRSWVATLLDRPVTSPAERAGILAGKAPAGQSDQGRIVCACFSVGLAAIEQAIREHKLSTVAEIGAALKAGTGCGSCIPELKSLLPAKASAA